MTHRRLRLLAVCASPRFIPFLLSTWDYMAEQGHETLVVSAPGKVFPHAGSSHQLFTVPIERAIAPARDAVALAELTTLIGRLAPDLVHAHGPKAGLLSMLAATAARVPARVYTMHGLRHETLTGPKRKLVTGLEGVSTRLAHQVLCVSDSVKARATRDGLLKPDQGLVLCHGSAAGVDAVNRFNPERYLGGQLREKLGLSPRQRVVGFVGRLARDKGLSELSTAWKTIAEEDAEAHLVVVGDLDPSDPVSIQDLQCLPRVHLLGFEPDPAPLYAEFDLLVLPTYREGFPQVLLEAAAMAVPAVATSVTGCVDAIVDGQTGRLVPSRDPGALARVTLELLRDPEARVRLGTLARRRALELFPIAPLAQATLELYERLVQG